MGSPTARALMWTYESQRATQRRNPSAMPPSQAHPLYRTKPCRNYAHGCCRFGDSCAYIHATPNTICHSPTPSTCPSSSTVSLVSYISQCPMDEHEGSLGSITYPPSPISSDRNSEVETSSIRGTDDGYTSSSMSTAVSEMEESSVPPPPPATPVSSNKFSDEPFVRLVPVPVPVALDSLKRNETSRSRRGSRTRPAPLHGINHYRTKPCRFYALNGECVKGDRCNFIHDMSRVLASNNTQIDPAMPSPTTTIRPSDVEFESTYSKVDSPERTSTGDGATKNFFPITWRVIGGGVRMGGHRDVCRDYMAGQCLDGEDCKFAHPDTYDDTPYIPSSDILNSPLSFFPFYDNLSPIPALSPVSPLYLMSPGSLNSFHVPSLIPPSPPVEPPPPKRSLKPKKKLSITPPVPSRPADLAFHRVLDGTTLLERQLPTVQFAEEPEDEKCALSPDSPSQGGGLFCARTIARPMSTPPTAHNEKVLKLFAAEA